MKQEESWDAIRSLKAFRAAGYSLLFCMAICVVTTMGILLQRVVPGWHTGIITGMLLLVVIDRMLTQRSLKSLAPFSSEWVTGVGVQWILIVIGSRVVLSYANGAGSLKNDLLLFAQGHIAGLITAEYLCALILAFMGWYLSASFAGLLDEIGLDQELVLIEKTPPLQGDAPPAHERLASLVFSTGTGLVVLTVLTRLNITSIESGIQISRFSGAEAGALLYFVFGLALLSLSRLMSLQLRWHRQHIPISSPSLVGQWLTYSLLFLLFLGVIVSLLPAGEGFGLLSLVRTLIGFIASVLFFFGQLLLMLISLLVSLPALLFGRKTPGTESVAPAPVIPSLSAQPPAPTAASETWLMIRPFLLWGLLATITVYALVLLVRQHGGLVPALRGLRLKHWLLAAWQWMRGMVSQAGAGLAQAAGEAWEAVASRLEGKRMVPPARILSLRALDPRRQVYFFYLAMVRRGAEHGLARKPSQTPSEYAASLQRALPSADQDIDSVTQAYMEARYSRKEVKAGQANLVKAAWARIRRLLRQALRREAD